MNPDDLQKEIDRLKSENTKLARDLAGAQEDLKEVRGEARDRRHEGKKLAEQLDALTKERDEFKTRAEADPERLRKRLAEAQGVIRGLKHDGAFATVAKTLKVNDPAKLMDLVKLAAYQPEGDEPDETKIATAFQAALKDRPWLVDVETKAATGVAKHAAGVANGTPSAQHGGKPGPGNDRGQSTTSESSSTPGERIPGRL
jgi:hypothetical protein